MLKEKQVCFTGTVRENRLPNCPIKSGKQLLKGNRGDFDCAVDANSSVLVVRWNDNSAVTVATNNGVVHPLVSVKLKGNRGDFDCAVDIDTNSSVLVVRWNDNSAVTVATNNGVVHPLVSVKRYNRKMKKELSVPQPNVIHEYNRNMGGVDLDVSQVDFRSYIVSVLLRGDMGTTSLSQEEDGE
ncbi:hypothetical protein QE152_g30411 [Popillia japonica]|uniref:PiggyBac transposable element-derived protein domain-containing protein n=1 Tax=Popillia japonica TaxID=7064 RepID=A0AAW1JES2_POPJA